MKRRVVKFAFIALALAVGGFLVAASGLIPVKASSGHWPITEWFLRFAMRRSVATHSLFVKVPPLDDHALVLKGATHFDIGCRSCHGAPGERPPRMAQAMLPRPPELVPRIQASNPKRLFYVVKHGLKFTGMPAWPAPHRDDEVWAVVAFLLKLPSIDSAEYRRLVRADTSAQPSSVAPAALETPAPRIPIQTCVNCHGRDGLGRGSPAFPRLAGQREEYLRNAIAAYARGMRHSGIMGPVAANLDETMIRELAGYYARLTPSSAGTPGSDSDAAAIARGRTIANEGIRDRRVPACIECHGPTGRRHKPAYPLLHGQPADYLVRQLELFKQGRRGGSGYAHLMEPVASRLDPEQMRDVAKYFESEAGSR